MSDLDLSRVGDLALELAEDIATEDDLSDDAKLLDAIVVVEIDNGHGETFTRTRSTTDRASVVTGLLALATEGDEE